MRRKVARVLSTYKNDDEEGDSERVYVRQCEKFRDRRMRRGDRRQLIVHGN